MALEFLLGIAALVVLLPVLVLFVQVLFALPSWSGVTLPAGKRPRLAVLVPAHNEAVGIADTLASVLPQLREGGRLLVVADNCSDETAAIAHAAGAEVIERTDSERRGKGYALDFGVRHLAQDPPEVLIIVDADCRVEAGAIDRLARSSVESRRPVQALYLMRSPQGAGLKTRIAEFAWLVKNQVRPLGFLRLGLPCQLMGTGMAFLWEDIRTAELASGHIVEDLKLGLDLCRKGRPPLFCPGALVTSVFPGSAVGLRSQRIRWEHGHLGVILSDAPKLILEAIAKGNRSLLALAFDLVVPPLALLTILSLVVFSAGMVLFAITGAAVPVGLASSGLMMLGAAVMLSWVRYGREVISLAALAYAPVYALLKIPLYLKFLISRQVEWVRSKRDDA